MSKAKGTAQTGRNQNGQGMVRQGSAILLAVTGFLAGIFFGWQGAVVVLNQEAAQGGKGGMHQQAQQGQSPMNSPLMAQAKALEEKAAANPNDPKAWADLGNTYFDAGLPDRAVAAYQKSLAIKPGQPDVWTDMGVMLRNMDKPAEAIKAFEQAAALDPKHQQSRLNIGVVKYFDLQDKDGAVAAWKALLAINPQAAMPDGKKVADALKEISK
ncbi:MAG: tetratricopeptide repeat protein [Thermodesulfobacteriota bacterium]